MINNSDYYLTLLLLVTCPKDLYNFEVNSQVLCLNFCTICNAIYHTISAGIQNEFIANIHNNCSSLAITAARNYIKKSENTVYTKVSWKNDSVEGLSQKYSRKN